MSKIPPIYSCLRHFMKFVSTAKEAQSIIRTNDWCVRFCQDKCLRKAEENCLKENPKICGKYCVDKCMYTGIPHSSEEDLYSAFWYPKENE